MQSFEERLLGLLEMYAWEIKELLKQLVGEIRELRYVLEESKGLWKAEKKGGE